MQELNVDTLREICNHMDGWSVMALRVTCAAMGTDTNMRDIVQKHQRVCLHAVVSTVLGRQLCIYAYSKDDCSVFDAYQAFDRALQFAPPFANCDIFAPWLYSGIDARFNSICRSCPVGRRRGAKRLLSAHADLRHQLDIEVSHILETHNWDELSIKTMKTMLPSFYTNNVSNKQFMKQRVDVLMKRNLELRMDAVQNMAT
jgi:hypothetical protein